MTRKLVELRWMKSSSMSGGMEYAFGLGRIYHLSGVKYGEIRVIEVCFGSLDDLQVAMANPLSIAMVGPEMPDHISVRLGLGNSVVTTLYAPTVEVAKSWAAKRHKGSLNQGAESKAPTLLTKM